MDAVIDGFGTPVARPNARHASPSEHATDAHPQGCLVGRCRRRGARGHLPAGGPCTALPNLAVPYAQVTSPAVTGRFTGGISRPEHEQ